MANNNKHTSPNVPALRFPEFSGEWEKMSLQDCCSDFSYGLNAPAKAYDGVNKYIRITDIDENTSVYKSDDPVSPDGLLSDEYLVNENDILFARTGASTGKTYLYNQNDGRLFYAGFLIKANVNNNCDPYFIFSQTKTQSYRRWVEIMSTRSGQPGINSQEYASYPLYVPSKEEQEKIALLLRCLDKRILVQSKIIEEHETLLKSLADKMFLQNIYSNQLSELVDIVKGKQLNADTLSETGDYYVMNGGITPSGYYSEYNVPAGAISISEGGNSCGYVQFNEKPFWSGGHCYSLQPKTTLVDYKYIYYYLKAKQADVMALRIGSGLPNIQKKDIEKFSISYPSLQSQKRIVKALDALSGKIYTEKHLLEKYCQQKSYLLSQMFI